MELGTVHVIIILCLTIHGLYIYISTRVGNLVDELFQVRFCCESSSGVQEQFHFRDFFVDLFHEVDDEFDQFLGNHSLGVFICDQERDTIPRHWDTS